MVLQLLQNNLNLKNSIKVSDSNYSFKALPPPPPPKIPSPRGFPNGPPKPSSKPVASGQDIIYMYSKEYDLLSTFSS